MRLSSSHIRRMKEEARQAMKDAFDELEEHPEVAESAAAAVGMSLGGAASYTALYFGGATVGLSAAGLTSGLATAGGLIGGGMAAGVAVLAAPVALLGIVGYSIAKNRKKARLAAALGRAIAKLYRIQARLIANAEYFRDELAEIKAYISEYERKMQ